MHDHVARGASVRRLLVADIHPELARVVAPQPHQLELFVGEACGGVRRAVVFAEEQAPVERGGAPAVTFAVAGQR